MLKTSSLLMVPLVAGGLFLNGCCGICESVINQVGSSAAESARATTHQAISDSVEASLARDYSPHFIKWYAQYLFALALGGGGIGVEGKAYAVGQWTQWRLKGSGQTEGSWIDRALLKTTQEGHQWWRVKFYDKAADQESIMEGLVSADGQKLLRLRARFPNMQKTHDMPVDEATYLKPIGRLSTEEKAAAKIGQEHITVPLGIFTTTHYQVKNGESVIDWWENPTVVGGVVKIVEKAGKPDKGPGNTDGLDANNFTLLLTGQGDGATSELGMDGAQAS